MKSCHILTDLQNVKGHKGKILAQRTPSMCGAGVGVTV